MSPVCPGWEGCLQQREHRGWVSGLWQQGCGQLHAAVAGWHASCLLWLCQRRLAGRISSIKAGVLWKALQTLLHPWALYSDTQDCIHVAFPPISAQTPLLLGFHSCTGRSAPLGCLCEVRDEVCRANGWSRAQAGKQEEILSCSFKPSPGQ